MTQRNEGRAWKERTTSLSLLAFTLCPQHPVLGAFLSHPLGCGDLFPVVSQLLPLAGWHMASMELWG